MASGSRRVRMSISTWNVHGLPPEKHSKLEKWLLDAPREQIKARGVPYIPVDIYVIGLQEVIPLNVFKLAQHIGPENERFSDKWSRKLQKVLRRAGDFVLYSREYMWGIHAFVFISRPLATSPYISDMSRGHIATGIANIFGDKGSVGIRFNCFGQKLCFVCCHLEAGEGKSRCSERNEDHGIILNKLTFTEGGSISDHDLVFYFGDLNYRLSGDEDGKTTVKVLKKKGYQSLIWKDELLSRDCTAMAFDGCEEMQISFEPTYKWKHDVNKYDTSERPAWTDRVIWRVQNPQNGEIDPVPFKKLAPLVYGRAELKTSDHRPVFAVFDVLGAALDSPTPNLTLPAQAPNQILPSTTQLAQSGVLHDRTYVVNNNQSNPTQPVSAMVTGYPEHNFQTRYPEQGIQTVHPDQGIQTAYSLQTGTDGIATSFVPYVNSLHPAPALPSQTAQTMTTYIPPAQLTYSATPSLYPKLYPQLGGLTSEQTAATFHGTTAPGSYESYGGNMSQIQTHVVNHSIGKRY